MPQQLIDGLKADSVMSHARISRQSKAVAFKAGYEFEALFQELESTLMDQHTTNVIDALNALELGLRDLGLWSDARPEPRGFGEHYALLLRHPRA